MRAVAKQADEGRLVFRCRDDEDVLNARQHEDADWIVDHRFVIDGQKLLGDSHRNGMQPCSRAACEDYAFHGKCVLC